MNPSGLRKRSRSTQAAGDSAGLGLVAGGAPGAGGAPKGDDVAAGLALGPHAQTVDPVAGGSSGAALAPDASAAPGASGPPAPCAPPGFPAAGAWWPAASPSSSDCSKTLHIETMD
ncbi:hypothetical protein E2562_030870 [Oryza meyeriana var. granulata]|uniref:Uncharacterized protein n=1 Tax=Oryza meyeriana var. granulata TaxID=110450 RepID=A0A6G1F066_9ORYZ|nr:hypothetical protein E2562_030870 [Oryza meyeriana var. granulata]